MLSEADYHFTKSQLFDNCPALHFPNDGRTLGVASGNGWSLGMTWEKMDWMIKNIKRVHLVGQRLARHGDLREQSKYTSCMIALKQAMLSFPPIYISRWGNRASFLKVQDKLAMLTRAGDQVFSYLSEITSGVYDNKLNAFRTLQTVHEELLDYTESVPSFLIPGPRPFFAVLNHNPDLLINWVRSIQVKAIGLLLTMKSAIITGYWWGNEYDEIKSLYDLVYALDDELEKKATGHHYHSLRIQRHYRLTDILYVIFTYGCMGNMKFPLALELLEKDIKVKNTDAMVKKYLDCLPTTSDDDYENFSKIIKKLAIQLILEVGDLQKDIRRITNTHPLPAS